MKKNWGYNMYSKLLLTALLGICAITSMQAQQQPDTLFQFQFDNPRYSGNDAPIIYIDGKHNNLHQLDGGFAPFAKLAERDGYQLVKFSSNTALSEVKVLVIANPINSKNQGNWRRPIYPAFAEDEILTIKSWVNNGGRLLLIADHMPFAGAANELANAFGFDFCDGFAQLSDKDQGYEAFTVENNRLANSILTDGTYGAAVHKVISFTGSSFRKPDEALGILKFNQNDRCLVPEIAWQFDDSTLQVNLKDQYQGAIMNYGKGKIAVFGEAALFTAQTISQNGNTFKVGFNTPAALENIEFVRNVLHWLSAD
ncbi:hypothetical protein [Nonlabens marinus]|uniref:hypothetical protein n=1 Tax=Nonlabens marinus TaxID=930802 RepID=UPI0011DD908A|nr:hypothetical protein [Nonlabens marinus]